MSAICAFRQRSAAPAAFEAFGEDCARLARSFTEKNEGRPLTAAAALEAKAYLIDQAERVVPALVLGAETKLALLNDLGHALASGR